MHGLKPRLASVHMKHMSAIAKMKADAQMNLLSVWNYGFPLSKARCNQTQRKKGCTGQERDECRMREEGGEMKESAEHAVIAL